MKIIIAMNNIEKTMTSNLTTEMCGEQIKYENKKVSNNYCSAEMQNTDESTVITVDFKTEFIIDFIDAIKPFVVMAKGLIPAVKSLVKQAREKMSKWDDDLRVINEDIAQHILMNESGVFAGYKDKDWVSVDETTKKFKDIYVHVKLMSIDDIKNIINKDKDAKFYYLSKTQTGDSTIEEIDPINATLKF